MQQQTLRLIAAGAFALLVAVIPACKKSIPTDPCDAITCHNGGWCLSGTCNCPPGYTGTQCEIAIDACDTLDCKNGGTCYDNSCHCPSPWIGDECQYLMGPSDIRVAEIRVLRYPLTNSSGNYWTGNANDYPDIYPGIRRTDADIALVDLSGQPIADADPSGVHTWIVNPAKTIIYYWVTGDLAQPNLELWRYTPAYSQLMLSYTMKTPRQYVSNTLPLTADGKQTITIETPDGKWKFELVLQYVW